MEDITTVAVGLYAADKIIVPFANKLLGHYADDIKTLLDERGKSFFQRVAQIFTANQQEPQPVDLKTLRPIVEGAILEHDETMIDKWAALLANAATPEGAAVVEPSFADVLRQLTPRQALILDKLYKQVNEELLQVERVWIPPLDISVVRHELQLPYAVFEQCMDNLIRLRLCTRIVPARGGSMFKSSNTYPSTEPTLFGYAFVQACKAPKSATTQLPKLT